MTGGLCTLVDDERSLNEGVRGALVVPALFDAVSQSTSVGAFIQTGRARMEATAAASGWMMVGKGGKARRHSPPQQEVEMYAAAPKPMVTERVAHECGTAVPAVEAGCAPVGIPSGA